mmetsp:Transcript_95638/g.160664  ORF Transcript_95638/g.160664 Transcript_95638/m.160664 type:complete len:246 (+) Transcript_95638:84-821(+)|eukprot:CAMPEP_0174368108 /NCGR_PEP_ID=MMETSP0811_2-20130205/87848_1 /TAXON_ID=73025 ORGANISM="Eutreptiella gymnastica-like, Strain CCMP1594" /NCGR_SAMPLE_ID=MMETSP0811_2 /ASSEMBLY_ACC=CAM_ASM_000667 /LENGTH=245 /DNA_ID=CAMNT_0015511307 /DNA_START=84 /DNA_END=821 /DNA_ORIENTATION=+
MSAHFEAIVTALVERVRELQRVIARYEETFPQLVDICPITEDTSPHINALLGSEQLPEWDVPEHAGAEPEVTLSEVRYLREENIRLQADNLKYAADKGVLMAEKALLSKQVKELQAKVVYLSEANSKSKRQIAKLVNQHAAGIQKLKEADGPKPREMPDTEPTPSPAHKVSLGGLDLDVDVVATLKGIYYTLLEDGTLPDTRSIMSSSTASQPAVASAFAKYVTAIRALEDTAEVDADAEADHEG